MSNPIEYAKQHRYRLRDLNRGGMCPPAIWKRPKGYPRSPKGDEYWAIVGRNGYVSDDGWPDAWGIACFYKSQHGVRQAAAEIKRMGGSASQIGEIELAGTIPKDALAEALKLIKVAKRRPGRPGGNPQLRKPLAQNAPAS